MNGIQNLKSKIPFVKRKKTDVIAHCEESLGQVMTKIEAEASLSEVREDYELVMSHLLFLADTERDTRLHARIRNVQSTFKNAKGLTEKKAFLQVEISRILSHLSNLKFNQTEAPILETAPTEESLSEVLLDKQQEEELAAFESSSYSTEAGVFMETPKLLQRLQDLQDRTVFCAQEIEKVTLENQTLFEGNKVLQQEYSQTTQAHVESKESFRVLQNKVATAQIECNRLLLEVQFLTSERAGVLQNLENEYSGLMNMAKRYKDLQRGYDLAKDETGVYEDLLTQVDSLLGRTRHENKVLIEKTSDSEKTMENLIGELRTIIKKGKVQFYSQLESESKT